MKYIFTSTNWFTKGLTCMVKDRHSVLSEAVWQQTDFLRNRV